MRWFCKKKIFVIDILGGIFVFDGRRKWNKHGKIVWWEHTGSMKKRKKEKEDPVAFLFFVTIIIQFSDDTFSRKRKKNL